MQINPDVQTSFFIVPCRYSFFFSPIPDIFLSGTTFKIEKHTFAAPFLTAPAETWRFGGVLIELEVLRLWIVPMKERRGPE